MSTGTFIVVDTAGRVACKGFMQTGLQAYRVAYGARVVWRDRVAGSPPPTDLHRWDTASGAQKFADMNGGTVTTVMECFYSPPQAAAI